MADNNDPAAAPAAPAAPAPAAPAAPAPAPGDTVLTGNDVPDNTTTTGEEGVKTAPDVYADFVLPEGLTLDEATLTEATPLFKELGLTQEQAQKLVDLNAKQVQAQTHKQIETFNQLMETWRTDAKNDKEFGGDKFDENVKIAQNAINKFGTSELKQLLVDHGIGNHPELIRFMVRVGHTLKEDVPGSVGALSNRTTDRVAILYPNNSKEE